MKPLLRVLIVEDSENDTRLLLRELERSDYEIAQLSRAFAPRWTGKVGIFSSAILPRRSSAGRRHWRSSRNGILICHLFSCPGRSVETLRSRQ